MIPLNGPEGTGRACWDNYSELIVGVLGGGCPAQTRDTFELVSQAER